MSKGQRRLWSAFDDDVLRTLHAAGRGVSWIAAFMVCAQCTIHRRARRLGLVFDEKHFWTAAEDQVLRDRYADEQTETIAQDLGLGLGRVYQRARKLGLSKSAAFYLSDKSKRIQRGKQHPAMIASRFPKGHVPANKGLRRPGWAPGRMAKTQFKKGEMSGAAARNYVPIGTEKIDKKRNVLMRKVTDDPTIFPVKRWRPVHVLVWEAAHGPVPDDGRIVVFKKGMKTFVAAEITADRLELVTLAENMRRNSYHNNYPKEVAQLIQLKGALNRKINRLSKEQGQ